jgi:peptidyl-prolyl cis-trans isomerase B (cyclophilin B)
MLMPTRLRLALLFALVAVAALLLAGCSQASTPNATSQSGSDQSAPPAAAADQSSAPQPAPTPGQDALHTSAVKVTGNELAVVKTSKGTITFKFFPKDAPNTVATFIELADKKFYDGTTWHRVVPGFVIQGGDPLSKTLPAGDPQLGSGGPGFRLKAEFSQQKHLEGTVALARAQDNDSGGSQFYICLAPQPSLDGQYTVFGQVVSGLDVVHKIAQGDKIESVRIESGK